MQMTYKSYPTRKDTPSRMTRKRARKEVFLYNRYEAKKIAKQKRKEEREKEST